MDRKHRRKVFVFALTMATLVAALPGLVGAQDAQTGTLHGAHEEHTRSALLNAEMNDWLAQSEEWTFFAEPGRSSLDFQDFDYRLQKGILLEKPLGEFSVTIHGVAPRKPLIPDLASASETNAFALTLRGRILEPFKGDSDTDISMLKDVAGTLVLSDSEQAWQVELRQENFSIMGATFQWTPEKDRVRGYFPVIMRHEESAVAVHAELFVVFIGEASKDEREVIVLLTKTPEDRTKLGYTAKLKDLLSSKPVSGEAVRSSVISAVESTVIELESDSGKPLGKVGNAEAIERILCAESPEMVQCDESRGSVRAVDLQLSGVPIRENEFGSAAWSLDLLLYPAASVKGNDGAIVTHFEQYSGALRIGSTVYEANQMLVGSAIGMSLFDAAAGSIRWTLPLGIGGESDPVARIVVSATCWLAGDSFSCDHAEISEASSSLGHPVGERPVGKLGAGVVISETRSLEVVQAIDAGKRDEGCGLFCPICKGSSSDCGGTGPVCGDVTEGCSQNQDDGNTCCQGLRAACRTDCKPGNGCFFYSTATNVVPLDSVFGSAAGIDLKHLPEAASCESVLLSRDHTFASGLQVLKDDWTLFGVDKSGALQAVGTSRAGHVDSRRQCISERPSGAYLVIDHIPHVMNDRYIPTPDVRLDSSKLANFDTGRLVVLFEYDDQGEFMQAELIYSSVVVNPSDLATLQEALEIDYHSQARHPLSVYAFVEFSTEKGKLVQDFLVTTPKCCQL